MSRPRPLGVAATVALLLSACGGGGGAPAGRTTSTVAGAATFVAAVEGLCLARSQAVADPNSVGDTFYDRSHNALHTIARNLEAVDRAVAARLLEAMNAVEAAVAPHPPVPTVAADLDRLIDVTREGLTRLAVPTGACR